MATIGTFTRTNDSNSFTGAVKTLSINAKTTIKPAEKVNDRAPDYRIFCNQVEYGAAWKKTSGEGREYLSIIHVKSLQFRPSFRAQSRPLWRRGIGR